MNAKLVLASTSRYRATLLGRLDVPFEQHDPDFDERAHDPDFDPNAVGPFALRLARGKAESVAPVLPDAWILASDQIPVIDGLQQHKPGTVENAIAQLTLLQGRTHELVTAVVLRGPEGTVDEHVNVHRMRMRPLDASAIEAYARRYQPLDCAGSYRIEDAGIALFEAIEGTDYTAVMGLPLIGVAAMLRTRGLMA